MLSTQLMKQQLSSEPGPLFAFLSQQIQRTLTNPDKASEIIKQCEALVELLAAAKKPVKILLSTYNTQDGIGDAMNLIGVYALLRKLFANITHVEIKAIAYIDLERLDHFKRALPTDDAYLDDICYFTGANTDSNHSVTILSSPPSPKLYELFNVISAKLPKLKAYCEDCDLFINLATPMVQQTHPFNLLRKDCIVHSILETGHTPNLILQNTDGLREIRQYREVSMGIHKQDVGFRLDAKLVSLAMNPQKLHQALAGVKSSALGKLIYSSSSQPRLSIGYLQAPAATHLATEVFIRTGDQSKNLVLICNIAHIEQYLKMNPSIKNKFTVIETANSAGTVMAKEVANPRAKRSLLLVDFRGIDEEVKRTLICVADVAMGSGDNSRADTMLSRLPFWQILQWKISDVSDFIYAIEKSYPTLANYMMLQLKAAPWGYELLEQGMIEDLVDYVNHNEDTLVSEWARLRNQILEKHNLDHYLSSLLLSALTNVVDKENTLTKLAFYNKLIDSKFDAAAACKYVASPSTSLFFESITQRLKKHLTIFISMVTKDAAIEGLQNTLFRIFPYFDVDSAFYTLLNNNQPLLFNVVGLNAAKCLSLILERQPDLNVNVRDPNNKARTPLHLAVQLGNVECIRMLLAAKLIDPSLKDSSGKTAEAYANSRKIKELFVKEPLVKSVKLK